MMQRMRQLGGKSISDQWIVLPDANAESEIPPPPTELRHVLYNNSVKTPKEIALDLGQSVLGNKRTLFNRLRDCPNATKVDDDTFKYHRRIFVGEDATRTGIPRWVVL